MRYQLLNSSREHSLIQRLLAVRNIDESIEQFLNPSLNEYRLDPYLLEGMEIAVNRIQQAILREERIMIF
jgi:single-stranded-DNA-specific exonuclease